jgi:hypothetical protein
VSGYLKLKPVTVTIPIAPPAILDLFSKHFDDILGIILAQRPNVKISGLGRSFIKKIKQAPPFLGLDEHSESAIFPEEEQKLEMYFQARQFVSDMQAFIRGGKGYRVKPGEDAESIARDQYGDAKFATRLREANPGNRPFPTGDIWLPYIDIRSADALTSAYINQKHEIAQYEWISPTVETLVNLHFLTYEEVVPILLASYEAARRTLADLNSQPSKMPTGSPHSQK